MKNRVRASIKWQFNNFNSSPIIGLCSMPRYIQHLEDGLILLLHRRYKRYDETATSFTVGPRARRRLRWYYQRIAPTK